MDFAKEPDAVFGRKCGSLAAGADSVIQTIPLHLEKNIFKQLQHTKTNMNISETRVISFKDRLRWCTCILVSAYTLIFISQSHSFCVPTVGKIETCC